MTLHWLRKGLRRLFPLDELTSAKLRQEFRQNFQIVVGLYSYGCFDRSRIDPNTHVGRYCSFARTSFVLNRNHGVDYLSTTPYLFNSQLGVVATDTFPYEKCEISDDVWIGQYAVVAPSARKIGRGAIVAAGAVVTSDVEPYAIVGGVPARVIRRRFSDAVIEKIEAMRWWEWDLAKLREELGARPDLLWRPSEFFGDGAS